MRKLCINLLLVFGMSFSVFGADSERHKIYEEENAKFEGIARSQSPINPVVPFDRSTKPFAFEGSREGLDEVWFVNGQRVSNNELDRFDQSSLKQPGATCCYVNMTNFARAANVDKQSFQDELKVRAFIILHTKYVLDPKDPDYDARLAEAQAYAERVDRYNALTKAERTKQMRKHLKRSKQNEKPTTSPTGTNNEQTFSKVWRQ